MPAWRPGKRPPSVPSSAFRPFWRWARAWSDRKLRAGSLEVHRTVGASYGLDMTGGTWLAAVESLSRATGPASPEQQELATIAGVSLRGLPFVVAAARLRDALEDSLQTPSRPIREDGALEWLKELADEAGRKTPSPRSTEELRAWVSYFLMHRRSKNLRKLKPEAGDLVRRPDRGDDWLEMVSSVDGHGRVWFRGRGRWAYPDLIEMALPASRRGASAEAKRQEALNRSIGRPERTWSLARHQDLAPFHTPQGATIDQVDELGRVVESARDEKPIQVFLQNHPELLASLVRGPDRYVVAQPRLADEYVPDFVVADADSNGVRWVLVEIETPRSSTTLKSKNLLEKHARIGLGQIQDWRTWLERNLHKAQSPRRDGGLGLYDISPRADGYLIVGREHLLNDNAHEVRRPIAAESRVEIMTYDRLLRRLRAAITYQGVPAGNTALFQRDARLQPDLDFLAD